MNNSSDQSDYNSESIQTKKGFRNNYQGAGRKKVSDREAEQISNWNEELNIDESEYKAYFDGGPGQNPAQDFSEFYKDHIKALFDEFQNKGKVDKNQFLDYLKESNVHKTCSLLFKKLEKERKNELDEREFKNLFCLDIKDPDDFELMFGVIDDLGNSSKSVGFAELTHANRVYDLGLKQEDIQIMFRYMAQQNIDSITLEELRTSIAKLD